MPCGFPTAAKCRSPCFNRLFRIRHIAGSGLVRVRLPAHAPVPAPSKMRPASFHQAVHSMSQTDQAPDKIQVRGARSQPQEHRCRHSARKNRRHCRRLRIGKILPGARRAVRRRLPQISRIPFNLHSAPHDPSGKGECRRTAPHSRRARPAPAPRNPRHPLDVRHGHGAAQQSSPDVLASCKPSLPQWALPCTDARSGRRAGARL